MREMKDSGIAWIGVIPQDWEIVRTKSLYCSAKEIVGDRADDFERLALTLNGVIKRSKEDSVGLQPEKFSGYQILKKGELVFKLIDLENVATSRVGLSPYTGIVSPAYIVLSKQSKAKDLVVRYSMYHFLSMWQREIFNQMGDNGVRSSLNTKELLNIPHPFPSIYEQKRIVTFLDAQCAEIDAVLEKTRASIEEYKKLKQAVITQAVTKGIRGDRPMKDSGIEWIGEISQDFEIVKLKWLCDVLDQFRSPVTADKRNQNADVLYDYYGASGAIDKIDGYTIDDHVMLIGEDGANLRMRNLPIMYEINGKAWVNNHAHILKPKAGVDFYFIFYALEALDLNYYITGSAQPKLSQDNLRNIWVPITDFTGQKRIAAYISDVCDEFDCLIAKKQQYLTEIENYKKSLIYEYVTGKKEVV